MSRHTHAAFVRRASLLMAPLFLAACATPTQLVLDAELERLCASEAGTRVFETVQRAAFKMREQGRTLPGDEYALQYRTTVLKKTGRALDEFGADLLRFDTRIVRLSDGRVLAEQVSFSRRGGDVPGPWHHSVRRCKQEQPSLTRSVFVGDSK